MATPSNQDAQQDSQPDDSTESLPRKTKKTHSARNKIMDYLARRNHSAKELRTKLGRDFPENEVEAAITFAEENGWMLKPQDLSTQVSEELHRKRKGHLYISHYLREKGLPPVARDLDREISKGRDLAEDKFGKSGGFSREEQAPVARLLRNRGFDDETIRTVMYEKP